MKRALQGMAGWWVLVGLVGLVGEVIGQPIWQQPGREGVDSYHAEATYTGAGGLEGDGWRGGEVDVFSARAGYGRGFPVGTNWVVTVGGVWDGTWFGVPGGAPLPEAVTVLALRAGVHWRASDRWSVLLDARPGIYSDFEDVSWRDVNVPVLVGVGYQLNTNVLAVLGVNVNAWSRLATIGGPGVMWRFAEGWRLTLILPRPSIDWSVGRGWTVFAGGEIRGGGWRVAEAFGREHGDASLDGDTVGYREIRVGGGVRWALGPWMRASLESGYALDREFEFRDAERTLDVDGAPYVQFSVGGVF